MDVFLSYSRRNTELCDRVYELLRRLDLTVFLDRHIAGGVRWHDELLAQLSEQRKPMVVLLATGEAVESPDWIRRELEVATEKQLTIVPVEFTPGAAAELLRGSDRQRVNARAVDDNLERDLRVALLGRRLEVALERRLEKTRAWRDELAREVLFWDAVRGELASKFDERGGLVLLGPAGAGKSTIGSLLVQWLLEGGASSWGRDRVFPILLQESDLRNGGESLARELGARTAADLQQHLERSRKHHCLRAVFVLDGLDQIVPDGDSTYRAYAATLQDLSNAAATLVMCRPEVWKEAYAGFVSLAIEEIDELSEPTVTAAWHRKFPDHVGALPRILRRPLFLDFALREAQGWNTLPQSDVQFLRRFRRTIANSPRGHEVGKGVDVEVILDQLAQLQIDRARFWIPRQELEDRLGSRDDAAISSLLRRRFLRTSSGPMPQVRCTHDLLDAFNMAWCLLSRSKELRAEFYNQMDQDGIWSVVAMLAAVADDLERPDVVREIFEEFLLVLDRKQRRGSYMNRAWGATYALQSRFEVFLPLILACFETDEISPSLPEGVDERRSSIAPACLTQEAASTLASAFQALTVGPVKDAPRVIPKLAGKLNTWKKRFRVVEALAKYDCDSARQALLEFARVRLRDHDDDRVLETTLRELRAFDDPDVVKLLRDVAGHADLQPRLRRVAAESLHALRPDAVTVPSRTDSEMVEDLRPFDVDSRGTETGQYSDWRLVEASAQELAGRISAGQQPSPAVLTALIRALEHDQTAVRAPVATCLGRVSHVRALDALIEELLKPNLAATVRIACSNSLRTQLANAGDRTRRRAMRVAMLRAARRSERAGRLVGAASLREVALDPLWGSDPVLDSGAAALPSSSIRGRVLECTVEQVEIPFDPEAVAAISKTEIERAGVERERKFRVAGISFGDGTVHLRLSPSSWPLSRAFHLVAAEEADRIPRLLADGLALPEPLGRAQLPGLAVVHAIVATADGKVLAARRSAAAIYSPLHWSISFEEQMTDTPDGRPEHPVETTLRGFREEFGIRCEVPCADVLGAILEIDTLNVAVVVLLHCPVSAAELRRSWETPPRPSHHDEASDLAFLDGTPESIDAALRGEAPFAPLHPTSRVRLSLLRDLLESAKAPHSSLRSG